MSSKQQGIRETIQLLSSILTSCKIPKTASESFRQAKFNKPEAVKTFLSLLFHVLEVIKFLSSSEHNGDLSTLPSFQTIPDEKMSYVALTVRKQMYDLGYLRPAFYSRFDLVGSRELLLGFIWLVHKSNLLTNLRYFHLRMANEVTIPLKASGKLLVECVEEETRQIADEMEVLLRDLHACVRADGIVLQCSLQRLVWLRGKLNGKRRVVLNTQHAYQKLADSLHQCTLRVPPMGGSNSSHLTTHELFLLRYPDQLSAYLKRLEWHISALQSLLEWEEHKELFWHWAESILDLQEREEQEAEDKSEDERTPKPQLPSIELLSQEVQRLEKEVTALVDKNKPHIDKIHHVWAMKQRHISSRDLEAENEKLSKDLSHCCLESKNRYKVHAAVAVEALSSSDRALYHPKPTSQTRKSKVVPALATTQQEATDIQQEASRRRLAHMHAVLSQNEEVVQKLRDDIAQKL